MKRLITCAVVFFGIPYIGKGMYIPSLPILAPALPTFPGLGIKAMTVCGVQLNVPILSYAVCQASISVIPASCHPGAISASSGASCVANAALIAGSCGVSVTKIYQIAQSCREGN